MVKRCCGRGGGPAASDCRFLEVARGSGPAREPDAFPATSWHGSGSQRAALHPKSGNSHLSSRRDGRSSGSKTAADQFPLSRSIPRDLVGLDHQGRGTGTLMRQAIVGFAFDHLGLECHSAHRWERHFRGGQRNDRVPAEWQAAHRTSRSVRASGDQVRGTPTLYSPRVPHRGTGRDRSSGSADRGEAVRPGPGLAFTVWSARPSVLRLPGKRLGSARLVSGTHHCVQRSGTTSKNWGREHVTSFRSTTTRSRITGPSHGFESPS